VEQGGVGRGCLAGKRVVGASVDQVDVEPTVFVVVQQRHTRAWGLEDVLLLRSAHSVVPDGEAGFGGYVLKDHRAGFYEAASGDGALFGVEHRSVGAASRYAHGLWSGLRGLRSLAL
jgi:hypothetical protein